MVSTSMVDMSTKKVDNFFHATTHTNQLFSYFLVDSPDCVLLRAVNSEKSSGSSSKHAMLRQPA